MNKRIVILGAGITGLSTAFYLEKKGFTNITIIDAKDRVGGKINTVFENGFLVESGADSFVTTKPFALDLIHELGMDDELIDPKTSKFYFLKNGELIDSPKGMKMMVPVDFEAFSKTKLFSKEGKKRILEEKNIPPLEEKEDESLGSFIERRYGKEMLENYIEPLFGGIYATPSEFLSINSTFPHFKNMELTYSSLSNAVQEMYKNPQSIARSGFMSLKKGMQSLVDKLRNSLVHTHFQLGTKVSEIVYNTDSKQYTIKTDKNADIRAEVVISTLLPEQMLPILKSSDHELIDLLNSFHFSGSHIITLAYLKADIQHPIDATGYLVPSNEASDISASTWTSEKWEGRAPENAVLIRCFFRENKDHLSDDELIEKAHQSLQKTLHISGKPIHAWVSHYENLLPQYRVGHKELIQQITERLETTPGLYLAGAAYEGVGVPDCIKQGKEVAYKIFAGL